MTTTPAVPPVPDADSCVWPIDTTCCDGWDAFDPALQLTARQFATEILWALSGRQFSACESTLRPCRRPCAAGGCSTCGYPGELGLRPGAAGSYLPWSPALIGGQWYNLTCPCDRRDCQCGSTVDEIELPGPVARVVAVYVDGEVLPEGTGWALYGSSTLVRTDGGSWPRCQDLAKDLTEPGTWGVTYVRGTDLPAAARRAAGTLACELARSCTGGKCRIPWQVTSVTRDGVSWTFDPTTFYERGLTGLPEVDMWLSSVNPNRLPQRSAVMTPQTVRRDRIRRQPGEVLPS